MDSAKKMEKFCRSSSIFFRCRSAVKHIPTLRYVYSAHQSLQDSYHCLSLPHAKIISFQIDEFQHWQTSRDVGRWLLQAAEAIAIKI